MSAKVLLPDMLGVVGGVILVKYVANTFFKTQTGYTSAAIQAGVALAAGMAGKSIAKTASSKKILQMVMIGGLAGAVVKAFDTYTAGKYSSYYTLADANPIYRIPTNYMPRLNSGRMASVSRIGTQ